MEQSNQKVRTELLSASDAYIDAAVKHADPMVLRGLIYQLTGDEELAAVPSEFVRYGYSQFDSVTSPEDIAKIQAKAAAFLKRYRDEGALPIPPGPPERMQRSLGLTAGADIPDSELAMWHEVTGLDPFVRGLEWHGEPAEAQRTNFKVAVVGAGMSGLNAAVMLKRAGLQYRVFEKNAGVGGTWYENRYPGARVDSPSRAYTHIFGVQCSFPYNFNTQSENLKYFEWVADNFELHDDIEFRTEVKSLVWDEAASEWVISAEGPDGSFEWRANAVFTGVGFLNRPNIPAFPGAETFTGSAFHTARWPEGLDLTGKRVAVIGTGATGYQLIPVLARLAGHTTVFQRKPSWVFDLASYLSPTADETNWLERNLPYFAHFARFRLSWIAGPQIGLPCYQVDPDYVGEMSRSENNHAVLQDRLAYIEKKLGGRPDLMAKMTPDYPPLSTRWIMVDPDDNIYDALLRDDVDLVTEPIARIGPNEIVTADGKAHPVDIIVYATGFRANDFLWPMEIRGREGVRIDELWEKDGPRAYMSTMLPGFPNLFMIYGPNANNFGGLQIVDLNEMATRFGLQCIAGLIERGAKTVDVTPEAYWRYNAEVDEAEKKMLYSDPRAVSYYRNEHGRCSTNNPIDIRRLWRWLRDPAGHKPELHTEEDAIEPVFGRDLKVG